MGTKKNVTEVVGAIVNLLSPLESEERRRVVQASLTLLGEQSEGIGKGSPKELEGDGGSAGSLPARAQGWMKQNDVSIAQLQQVFHFADGEVKFIAAEIPGKNKREKVRNAYVLLGTARLLSSGDAKFDDKAARSLCEDYGVYDQTNHMKYMKGGNEFTGSKDRGWTLTAPGLKHGAVLVKGLSG